MCVGRVPPPSSRPVFSDTRACVRRCGGPPVALWPTGRAPVHVTLDARVCRAIYHHAPTLSWSSGFPTRQSKLWPERLYTRLCPTRGHPAGPLWVHRWATAGPSPHAERARAKAAGYSRLRQGRFVRSRNPQVQERGYGWLAAVRRAAQMCACGRASAVAVPGTPPAQPGAAVGRGRSLSIGVRVASARQSRGGGGLQCVRPDVCGLPTAPGCLAAPSNTRWPSTQRRGRLSRPSVASAASGRSHTPLPPGSGVRHGRP